MAKIKAPEVRLETEFLDKVKEFQKLEKKLAAATEVKTELQKKYDEYRYKILPEMMENIGLQTVTAKGIGRINVQDDVRVAVVTANKEAALQWLEDHGLGNCMVTQLNASSLKAVVRQAYKDGGELPPEDYFKIEPFSRVSITKV